MQTYKIRRFYQRDSVPTETVMHGLTLEQAQEHCDDPENSSRTCTAAEGHERTERFGAWFEGFDVE